MKLPRLFTSRRARVIAAALALGASGLVYTAARSRVLLANGRAIEAQSAGLTRDYFVGAKDAPALTYLVMGDSTAAGWGAGTLAATYPYLIAQSVARRGFRVHVVNVAKGGATLREVRVNQLLALNRVRPNLVTLSVGANDATHFTALDAYARDLQAVMSALHNSAAQEVLVANTPDMWLAPALPLPLAWAVARRARAQNVVFDKAVKNTRLRTVDLYGRGKLDARRDPTLYAADRFHPSAAGYAKWAPLFIEASG